MSETVMEGFWNNGFDKGILIRISLMEDGQFAADFSDSVGITDRDF